MIGEAVYKSCPMRGDGVIVDGRRGRKLFPNADCGIARSGEDDIRVREGYSANLSIKSANPIKKCEYSFVLLAGRLRAHTSSL